jgi:hypothetical protein
MVINPITVTRIIVNAPGIVTRAKRLRNKLTKQIGRLQRSEPGIEHMRGLPECYEIEEYKAVLRAVRWVLFGGSP